MFKKFCFLILACFCSLIILFGCSKNSVKENNNLTILCEDYVQLLAEDLVDNYNVNSKSKINIEVLTNKEIESKIKKDDNYLIIGYNDYSNNSYSIKQFALDGVGVIVNKKNTLNNISLENLKYIYNGKLKNWSQLGYNDSEIIKLFYENSLSNVFEKNVIIDDVIDKNILILDDVNNVKDSIMTKQNCIGFIPLMYIDNNVKKLKVNGIELNFDNLTSSLYPLSMPIYISYSNNSVIDFNDFIKFLESENGTKVIQKHCLKIQM